MKDHVAVRCSSKSPPSYQLPAPRMRIGKCNAPEGWLRRTSIKSTGERQGSDALKTLDELWTGVLLAGWMVSLRKGGQRNTNQARLGEYLFPIAQRQAI
jgi:hypothetical protein